MVDRLLRVIGIENLRLAGTAIIPQVISGNMTPCAMLIGEKAADPIANC